MLHRTLLLATTTAVIGAAGWLLSSESGLQATVALAQRFTAGQLQIEQARGRLIGPLDVDRFRWQSPSLQIEADSVHLDWSPSDLLQGALEVAELSASRLSILSQPSDSPSTLPASLELPLTVNAKKVSISQILWGKAVIMEALNTALSSDGRQHRLSEFSARLAGIALSGEARLDGAAPFPLEARAEIAGQLDQRPLAMQLTAKGPLERLDLRAVATQGIEGHAETRLTPFAETAFSEARLLLDNIDPSTWAAGAPHARLSVSADIAPQGEGIVGSFGLTNHQPGPLDKQRLPLNTLAGTLEWQGQTARFERLHAELAGRGQLDGRSEWRDNTLSLDLNASRIDARQLVSVLQSTRLSGPVAGQLSAARQSVKFDLRDRRFKLAAEARHAAGQVEIVQLLLSAGDARLTARGELDLDENQRFSAEGELHRFDPARFAELPAAVPGALINARYKASGHLSGKPTIEASFSLADSRLAGQPLSGEGVASIRWPQIPKLELQLSAGTNRLSARGAFGGDGDVLDIDLAAQQLTPYGLDGTVDAHFALTGGTARPRLTGQATSPRLGLPGGVRLSGLTLKADLGGEPASPMTLDIDLARFDTSDQAGLLRALRIRSEGSNQRHRLTANFEIAGRNTLNLAAEGGIDPAKASWQGQLTELRFDSTDTARNFYLQAPAPLRLSDADWQFGPMRLSGRPQDWQATLTARADTRQLQAALQAQGSRIGRIDGELKAAMLGPWSLDRQSPWRGTLATDIADLGWLAELIGEGWQSAGRIDSRLQIAGTPAKPLASGNIRGDKLALRLPEQGLNLADGELEAELHDNLLRIQRLRFDSLLQALPRALRVQAGKALAGLTDKPGKLEISGEIRVDRESATLNFHLDRLGAFQLPDQWIAVSGDGQLGWQDGTLAARGELAVNAGYWQLAPGGTPRLSEDVVVIRPGTEPAGARSRTKLNLDIRTDLGNHFLFRGAGLTSNLDGSIRISAQGSDLPRATGTIRTSGGRFDAYGQKLDIERGILSFNGLLDNPGLDVRALRKGLSVEAGVQISGTVRRPVVRLVSDPDLPDAEKLAWLVLGHGPEQMSAGDASILLSAAGGLLGNDSGGVVQQVKKTFGFDEFGVRQGSLGDTGGRQQVSRVAGGSTDTTGTTGSQILSVGKRLSSNALLSYEQTLGKAEGVVKLTVNLTRRISVIGRAGSDNALDVFYTFAFGRAQEKPVWKQQGSD